LSAHLQSLSSFQLRSASRHGSIPVVGNTAMPFAPRHTFASTATAASTTARGEGPILKNHKFAMPSFCRWHCACSFRLQVAWLYAAKLGSLTRVLAVRSPALARLLGCAQTL
jgi:hypothetical protein